MIVHEHIVLEGTLFWSLLLEGAVLFGLCRVEIFPLRVCEFWRFPVLFPCYIILHGLC